MTAPGAHRRGVLVLAALAGTGLAACRDDGAPPAGEGRPAAPADVAADDRIAPLLARGAPTNAYDVPTGDMLPRLIDKLEHGHLEPLKRAKEELGGMGDRAIPALERFIARHYANAFSGGFLENALDALAMNDSEAARPILLACLDHPQESVRIRAAQAFLLGHARAEDFDRFAARLESGEGLLVKKLLAPALFLADPARATALYLAWVRDGAQADLLPEVLPNLARARDPAAVADCRASFRTVDEPWRSFVAAPAAGAGDEAALDHFRRVWKQGGEDERLVAAHALSAAGLLDLLAPRAGADPSSKVRSLAAAALAAPAEIPPPHHALLTAALDDPAADVAALALKLLAEHGDATALDRALRLLGEAEGPLLGSAVRALLVPLGREPGLAERAWEVLSARAESEAHMPVEMRTATFKAIGIVPLPAAAEYLYRVGVANAGVRIEGLPAHRWLMIQAGNTGPAGRRRLRALLAGEEDPLRRLDLISAVGSARTADCREDLQVIAEKEARTPYEVLLAASLLVKVGPSSAVAERLKRVYFRLAPGDAFDALESLLWEWY
ncbi:MAG: hypothetical protein AB1726_03630 [Planctomycetota bacterium]